MAARPKLVLGKLKKVSGEEAKALFAGEQTSDITLLGTTPRAEPEKAPQTVVAAAAAGGGGEPIKAKPIPAPAPPTAPTTAPTAPTGRSAYLERVRKAKELAQKKTRYGIDITKFDPEEQEKAQEILDIETANPYEDKTEDPIFPLQTRLGFTNAIVETYRRFIKVPDETPPDFDACKKMGSGAQQKVEIYEYQKFVREYIRNASPYRGILVYHGLGSGKTCSAIAAAEALFSVTKKKILVMTPSSLRDNFLREITFCGFQHFRIQNHWTTLDKENPTVKLFAEQVLGLPKSYIARANNIWVPDFKQESNFNTLDTEERQEITKQLGLQINSRIEFLNYNGITATKLKEIACNRDAEGNTLFDNKVIVIDEFHNMTRLMQGVIEPYITNIPGIKRKVPMEPVTTEPWNPTLCAKETDPRRRYLTNYMRGFLFYRLLCGARNSKIIALSGTPLINFPEELGIMANVLNGYLHTCSFNAVPASGGVPTGATQKVIESVLKENIFVDFEEVKLEGLNCKVLFSRVPEGTMKVFEEGELVGVKHLPEGTPFPSIQTIYEQVRGTLTENGIKITFGPEFKAEPLLPPVGQEFREKFLQDDGKTIKNSLVLGKRLQGLISYYRGSKKELMPEVTRDEVVRVPFSPYAQAEYQRVRATELDAEKREKKVVPAGMQDMAARASALWAQISDLAQAKQSNSYRMFSRQACNFAFPEGISRPRPSRKEEVVLELGKDIDLLLDSVQEGSKQAKEEDVELEAIGEEDKEAAEAEDEQTDEGAKAAAVEEERNAGNAKEAEEIAKAGEPVLIPELAPVAPVGAVVSAAAAGGGGGEEVPKKLTLSYAERLAKKREEQQKKMMGIPTEDECKKARIAGEDYAASTKRAKSCLINYATEKLRLFEIGIDDVESELKSGKPINPDLLQKYSPKYAAILTRVLEGAGSSLVYSNFLDMEGIGIFLIVLKANGFEPITIESDGAGSFKFSEETIKSLEKGPRINRYLSFTGKEDRAIRSMALKVFNAKYSEAEEGTFTELPPQMSDVLVKNGFTGNLKGELCRVFCITGAGAEGLSLRNVRRVHIMEPHWNHVRTDQVKGRAVRICSHIDLEYSSDPTLNQRTVEVFTYVSTYNSAALVKPDGSGLFPRIDGVFITYDGLKAEEAIKEGLPIPAGAPNYILTTDEYMYRLSHNKKTLLENIQGVMKDAAVDCRINFYENEEEQGCINLPGEITQYAYHPLLTEDIKRTGTMYGAAAAAGKKAVAAPVAVPVAAAAAAGGGGGEPVAAPGVATIKARIIDYLGKRYLAVPVKEARSGVVFEYALYAPGDKKRVLRLGTSIADSKGMPTSDITIFP